MRLENYPVRITKNYEENGIPISLFGADYYLVPIEEEIEDWKEFEEIEGRILEELSSLKVYFIEPEINSVIYKLKILGFEKESNYLALKINIHDLEKVIEEFMEIGMAMYPFSSEFRFWTGNTVKIPNLEKGTVIFAIIYRFSNLVPESENWIKKVTSAIQKNLKYL